MTTTLDTPEVKPVFTKDQVVSFQQLVRRVPVSRHVLEFAIDLARASRPMAMADNFIRQYVEWGAGPRAPQCLVLGARTLALLRGLPTPSCREVRDLAAPVLQHRIIPNYNASGDGIDAQKIIERLLIQVKEATYK